MAVVSSDKNKFATNRSETHQYRVRKLFWLVTTFLKIIRRSIDTHSKRGTESERFRSAGWPLGHESARTSADRAGSAPSKAAGQAAEDVSQNRLAAKKLAEEKASARTLARAQAVAEKLSTATEQVASAIAEANSAVVELEKTMHSIAVGRRAGIYRGGGIPGGDQSDRESFRHGQRPGGSFPDKRSTNCKRLPSRLKPISRN